MAQSGNQTLRWVLVGCGVLSLIGTCCIGIGGLAYCKFTESLPSARAYLSDIRAGNYPAALQRMDGPYQSTHDVASFEQSVRALPGLSTHSDFMFRNFNTTNDIHTATGELVTPQGPVTIQMELRREGDHFYIRRLNVGGQDLR